MSKASNKFDQRMRALKRRINWLTTKEYTNSYDKAELAALHWAVELIEDDIEYAKEVLADMTAVPA